MEKPKETRGFWKLWQKIQIEPKCKKERMRVFGLLEAVSRVANGQKIAYMWSV